MHHQHAYLQTRAEYWTHMHTGWYVCDHVLGQYIHEWWLWRYLSIFLKYSFIYEYFYSRLGRTTQAKKTICDRMREQTCSINYKSYQLAYQIFFVGILVTWYNLLQAFKVKTMLTMKLADFFQWLSLLKPCTKLYLYIYKKCLPNVPKHHCVLLIIYIGLHFMK